MIRRKPFFRLAMILTALLLCLNYLQPGFAESDDRNRDLVNAVSRGLELVKKVPSTKSGEVVGYAYQKTLPSYWEAALRGIDLTYLKLSKAFTNMSRERYYFTMALTMCASQEKLSWFNSKALADILGKGETDYSKNVIDQLMDVVTDSNMPYYDEEIGEMMAGYKAVGTAFHSVKEMCEAANMKVLLDSLDWKQFRNLTATFLNSGNNDMKRMGETFERVLRSSGDDRTREAVMSVLKDAGLDMVAEAVVDKSIESAAGTVGLVYKGWILAVDSTMRFSVLTGNFSDMLYASEVTKAAETLLNTAVSTFHTNEKGVFDESKEALLIDVYETVLYCGINYLEACAVMNDAFAAYVEVAKSAPLIREYVDGAVSSRAEQGREDAAEFRRLANELREELEAFRNALEKRRNSGKPGMFDKAAWTRYYMTRDNSQGEMIITAYMNGTTRMRTFFAREWDHEVTLQPRDDGLLGFADGWVEGTLTAPWESSDLTLRVTGGDVLDSESDWAYLFENQEIVFHPASYDELWYEKPADGIRENNDWLGHWALIDDNHEFHIDIDTYSNEYHMNIVFDQKYHYFATLEIYDEDEMYFYTEKFNTGLTLNRKLKKIALNDIGCMVDELSDWLDEYNYRPEFTFVSEKYYDNYNTK